MQDNEKKWILILIAAVIFGVIFGKIMSILLGTILVGTKWDLLVGFMIPLFTLLSILVVAFFHQKEKERTIE
jgi:hypothetical protein